MKPTQRYYHDELGFNYRLTNIQAALGLAQLEQIEEFIAQRRRLYRWYAEGLSEIPGLAMNVERSGVRNVFWMSCLVLGENLPLRRSELMERLRSQGIDSRPFFIPMHMLPHLRQYRIVKAQPGRATESSRLGDRGLNLPSGPHLNQTLAERVVYAVRQALSSR